MRPPFTNLFKSMRSIVMQISHQSCRSLVQHKTTQTTVTTYSQNCSHRNHHAVERSCYIPRHPMTTQHAVNRAVIMVPYVVRCYVSSLKALYCGCLMVPYIV